jgi:transposase-like protein
VPHARSQHPNAPLTPQGRRRMVWCVIDQGWTIEATAERFQVDAKTVRKRRDRFLAEGAAGLEDRSSRPRHSPTRTRRRSCRRVVHLRNKRRWGADRIAFEVGLAASTVQAILNRAGCGRLDRGDRATDRTPPWRYQRDRPGELVHVDVKKLGAITRGGAWKAHGRDAYPSQTGVGYRCIHTALDDRTRIIYSEILDDEQAATAAAFWTRAAAWFATLAIACERVITDNGACYRSGLWHRACTATNTIVKQTRPRRPKTMAKSSATTGSCSKNGPTSALDFRRPTRSRLPALHPLLQSPPTPRRTRMGNTHQHPRGQPVEQPARSRE